MTSPVRAIGRAGRHFPAGAELADKYVIERVVREADATVVIEAVRRDLDQPVVLKVLARNLLSYEAVVARFMREARRAGSLRSAHALRVLDVGRLATGEPYFASERLDGSTLAAALAVDPRVEATTIDRALEIITQAIDAVGEMHERGWVHGDLKPRNLFLATRTRGLPLVKVCECDRLGLLAEVERIDASLTPDRMIQGESLYLAPEQLDPRARPDPAADVWALGAILYELLTGRSPFEAATVALSTRKIAEASVEAPSALNPAASRALDDVVIGCLQRDPQHRFRDAYAMLEALEDALEEPSDTALIVPSRRSFTTPSKAPPAVDALKQDTLDRDERDTDGERTTESKRSGEVRSEAENQADRGDRATPTKVLSTAPPAPVFGPVPSVVEPSVVDMPSVVTSSEPSSRSLHFRPHPLAAVAAAKAKAPPRVGTGRVLLLVLIVGALAAAVIAALERLSR